MRRLLFGALMLLALPAMASAEISVGLSIEMMVADADLVVRARFQRRGDIDGWPAGFSVSTFRVEETLLGEAGKQQDVLARDLSEDGFVEGGEYLLFLYRHCRQFRDPVTNGVAARTPFELRGQIRLDAPIEEYTMACERITDRAALLKAVRTAAEHTRGATMRPPEHRMEVPLSTSAFRHLYGGSAVYMSVPVDGRLARLAREWRRSEDPMRREAGEESLRIVAARALSLERIAGRAGTESGKESEEDEDPAERLEKAESAIEAVRADVRRSLEAYEDGDLRKSLLRIRLSRLSRGPEDRTAWGDVLARDFDALAAAARGSLWKIVLENHREDTDRVLALCERIDGRIAFNVLRLRAWQDGSVQYVTFVEERLYCFAGETGPGRPVAGYVDHIAFYRGGLLQDTLQGPVEPCDLKGTAHAVPDGMKLTGLHLSTENLRHWSDGWGFLQGAPIWAAPFLFGEFREAFPPTEPNREGETDPKRR